MRTFEDLVDMQSKLIDDWKKLAKQAKKVLKKEGLSESEIHRLENVQKVAQREIKAVASVGYVVPHFFVGDLLDFNNYFDYYDSIFYKTNIVTSREERVKGNKHLKDDAYFVLGEKFSNKEWAEMSKEKQSEEKKTAAVEVINQKVARLESTTRILEVLQDQKDLLSAWKREFVNVVANRGKGEN